MFSLKILVFPPFILTAVVLIMLLQACDSGSDAPCSGESPDFFRKSLDAYFASNLSEGKAVSYEISGRPEYDYHNDWWGIPLQVRGEAYTAILSCDGYLELSIGN